MKRNILLITTFFFMTLAITSLASANRFVVVNGVLQHPNAVYEFEQLCGPIADGFYWVNWNTGDWGYPGDWYPRGNLNDICSANGGGGNSNSQGRTWRDEGLFSTHDLCPECELALP
jgi:hypothetical protein